MLFIQENTVEIDGNEWALPVHGEHVNLPSDDKNGLELYGE